MRGKDDVRLAESRFARMTVLLAGNSKQERRVFTFLASIKKPGRDLPEDWAARVRKVFPIGKSYVYHLRSHGAKAMRLQESRRVRERKKTR